MAIKLLLNFIYIKVLGIAYLLLRLGIIQVNLSSALALHANYILRAADQQLEQALLHSPCTVIAKARNLFVEISV